MFCSRVCLSFCLSTGLPLWNRCHGACSNLFTSPPPHPRPDQTWTPQAPQTCPNLFTWGPHSGNYWQAVGWPSTERLSCFKISAWFLCFHWWWGLISDTFYEIVRRKLYAKVSGNFRKLDKYFWNEPTERMSWSRNWANWSLFGLKKTISFYEALVNLLLMV